jgi:hypothetical protein
MPTSLRYFRASASASCLLFLLTIWGPIMQFFSAFILAKRLKDWNTMPTLERK